MSDTILMHIQPGRSHRYRLLSPLLPHHHVHISSAALAPVRCGACGRADGLR